MRCRRSAVSHVSFHSTIKIGALAENLEYVGEDCFIINAHVALPESHIDSHTMRVL